MAILFYIIESINPKGEEYQIKAVNEEMAKKNAKFLEEHGYTCVFITPLTDDPPPQKKK